MPEAVRAFLKAVAWGAFVPGCPFLVGSVPLGLVLILGGEFSLGLYALFIPFLLPAAWVFPSMLFICLPLTLYLRSRNLEDAGLYTKLGMIAGAAIAVMGGLIIDGTMGFGLFLGIFGAVGGAVSGRVWGKWREEQAQAEAAEEQT